MTRIKCHCYQWLYNYYCSYCCHVTVILVSQLLCLTLRAIRNRIGAPMHILICSFKKDWLGVAPSIFFATMQRWSHKDYLVSSRPCTKWETYTTLRGSEMQCNFQYIDASIIAHWIREYKKITCRNIRDMSQEKIWERRDTSD